jgi:hypothetical protein
MFKWFRQFYGKDARGPNVSKDISILLNNWPLDSESVNAKIITGYDDQPQLQLRLDCGILQMYLDGRPDGLRPHKCQTLLEYLERQAGDDLDTEGAYEAPQKVWNELDREMTQFYHRRLALLTVARQAQDDQDDELARACYRRAARDAEYTLRAMDFIRLHCKDEDNVEVHERFRPFVLWHWTIALTQQRIIDKDFDLAVEQVKQGMGNIAKVYEDHGLTKWLKHDPSMAELRILEKQIRKRYGIQATLHEQLQTALAREDYEHAARIRDELRAKGRFPSRVPMISGEEAGF